MIVFPSSAIAHLPSPGTRQSQTFIPQAAVMERKVLMTYSQRTKTPTIKQTF